jgi:hypothetical protein
LLVCPVAELEDNLQDLHARVQRGAYRALPARRRYIPKPGGKQRPLGIAALEDKIVQRAVVAVLNAIYEEDFLGFSYGFRPKRNQHQALDALAVGICRTPVNWILDADIRSFFDSVSQEGWSDSRSTGSVTSASSASCASGSSNRYPYRNPGPIGANISSLANPVSAIMRPCPRGED